MKKILTVLISIALLLCACFSFAGCGEKELLGFDIDFAREVAKELNLKVVFKEIDWDAKETELNSKAIDVIWNGFTYTTDRDNGYYDEEREAQIGGLDFSNFYMENKQVAVVKKSNVELYKQDSDFATKSGCAEATSAGESTIKNILGTTSAQLEKQLDVFTAVKAGTYDFGVVDLSMASEYISNAKGAYNDSLAVIEIDGVEAEYYAVAFREGSNLKEVFDYEMAKLYANGKAQELAEKYSQDSALYNGFTSVDTVSYTLPTDGDYKYVKDKGTIVIGYTIFAPMAYFAE